MDNETLKELQACELEILTVVDAFCKKHEIRYSLYAGTALGAVRHGGFIPWDDDVDIAMLRTEFDKFCRAWEKEPVEGYYLDSILTNKYCSTCHAKVRKDGTVFLSSGEVPQKAHNGIWVDVFPIDIIPDDVTIQKEKYRKGTEIILLTRPNYKSRHDMWKKKIMRTFMRCIPMKIRNGRIMKDHQWLVDHMHDMEIKGYSYHSMSTIQNIPRYAFQKEMFETYTTIGFCDKSFAIVSAYDEMLKETFGDYMQLPPESEQVCKHNPDVLQF